MWLLPNTKSPLAQVPIPVSRMCFRVCEQLVFSVVQRQSEGSFGDLQLLLTQPFVQPYLLLQGGSNHVTITAPMTFPLPTQASPSLCLQTPSIS